jgi:hypothetical protein
VLPDTTVSQLKQLIATPDSPELGPGPRPQVQPLTGLQKQIEGVLDASELSGSMAHLIQAIVLLWHDHLDAAHTIAQEIETTDGSYVHGIMHRREPDYGNAKYWFRRVGKHACFPALATQAKGLIQADNERVFGKNLISGGDWDPFAFVDACQQVEGCPVTDARVRLLVSIQRAEFEILLQHFCGL